MRCPPRLLPGSRFMAEPCPARPEPFANTCQPLSITKGPAPRCRSSPQAAAEPLLPCQPLAQPCQPLAQPCQPLAQPCQPLVQPCQPLVQPCQSLVQPCQPLFQPCQSLVQPCKPLVQPCQSLVQPCQPLFQPCQSLAQPCKPLAQPCQSLVQPCQPLVQPCQPLLQPCLLLCPEPCEPPRLLPRPRDAPRPQAAPRSPRGGGTRVARSLPPCAPRCPEPGRLRFPPCGVRCSSASCRGQCPTRKAPTSPPRRPEPTSGYSLPLRGVTECPPPPSLGRCFLREQPPGVAPQRCSKGYPTQELTCCSPEQRPSSAPAPRGVAKATAERAPLRAVAKGSLPLEGSKGRSCSAQHLSKTRCGHHARAAPRPSRLAPAGPKRSGHSKKSRCASKWLW